MNAETYFEIIKKILENIEEGVHFVDKNQITKIYSEKMSKLEDMPISKVLEKDFRTVFKDIKPNDSTLLKALNYGVSTENYLQRYTNLKGKEIISVNSTFPIKVNNKIIGALEIAKDLTIIQKLSEEILKLQKVNSEFEKKSDEKNFEFKKIIGESAGLKKILKVAEKASKSDAPVFIYGETGTGKELISQAIHYSSERKNKDFIAINCSAIPETLFESIFFGTTKGSFTGAIEKSGLFEQANGGTLLLDEINSIPPLLQSKLLRVLQEKKVRRVGGIVDIPIDVRIISTTNEKPEDLLEAQKIRKDLYYRLNVIYLNIPPLKDRKEDILVLTKHFINKYKSQLGANIQTIDEEVEKIFLDYPWQGNVRELENVIYSVLSMNSEEEKFTKEMLPAHFFTRNDKKTKKVDEDIAVTSSLNEAMALIEEKQIIDALKKYPNNFSKAAAFLGISRQNLNYKMKKYKIQG